MCQFTSIIADKKVRNIVPGNINVGTSYRREAPKPRRFIVMICGSGDVTATSQKNEVRYSFALLLHSITYQRCFSSSTCTCCDQRL